MISTQQFYELLHAGKPNTPLRFYAINEINSQEKLKPHPFQEETPRNDKLNPIELLQADTKVITEEKRTRYMLIYDSGIAHKAEAACKTLTDRDRPIDKFGWAGQFAYDGHLHEYGIKRDHDDPFYSSHADTCDFRINFNGKENRLEVKTTHPKLTHKECRVYKYRILPDGSKIDCWNKPDYIIAIKCTDDYMRTFKLYGWLTWEDIEKHGDYQEWEEGGRWGIPLHSPLIKDYTVLLNMMESVM